MASLNRSSNGKMKTKNLSGHAAYKLDDKTKLVTMSLTTMLGEPKFYGDNTDSLIMLAASLCRAGQGEFVAKMAVWARTEGKLRSVSHALIAVAAHWCHGNPKKPDQSSFVRKATRIIASMRGDDGTEILATYKALYGKPIPNALRRGVRDAQGTMSAFSIAKYQSKNKDLKLRDALRIAHPVACDERAADAMGKAVADELPMPKSWETELSERGNTKEVWDELIAENRLGIFAQVRNLRNMLRVGANVDPVLANLMTPEVIAKSRMLPFRFYSAYQELKNAGLMTTKVARALDAAMTYACANVDPLPGKTAVLIDKSGSMAATISRKSTTRCADIAFVLGAMMTNIADDAWVCAFNSEAHVVGMNGISVLSDLAAAPIVTGGTNMGAAFDLLMDSGFDADRIILLSDNEVNMGTSRRWYNTFYESGKKAIQTRLEKYRKKVGHDVWCHAIDLQGYGTSQFIGPKVNIMAGWSDSLLRFVSMAEQGYDGIVADVENVDLDKWGE